MTFLNGITNIIMDCADTGVDKARPEYTSRSIPLDDLKRLHDSGAGAVYQWMPWDRVEPERGWYDWSMPDDQVNRSRAAGLKVIMLAPSVIPAWMPDDWYCRYGDGFIARAQHPGNLAQSWPCLSPWHPDAQEYHLRMIERVCTRYNSDDVVVIGCQSQDGESILPPAGAAIYDDHAVAAWRRWIGDDAALPNPDAPGVREWMFSVLSSMLIEQHKIYVKNEHGYIGVQMHPVYQHASWSRGSGVYNIPAYYHAIHDAVIPREMVWTVFSYFPPAFRKMWPSIHALKRDLGMTLVTGSEWAQGLRDNTQAAIDVGIDALLMAPIHPFLFKESVTDDDVAAVKYSTDLRRGK